MTNAIQPIWRAAGLSVDALAQLSLTGHDPVLGSSFAVGKAAQASLAAAALAATQIGELRNGLRQQVRVDMRHAALECAGRFEIDGRALDPALADLREPAGRDGLRAVLRDAHVFVQGYRPGAFAALGFAPAEVAAARPGVLIMSISAYGESGPWADKRGFDSLVQAATGFNDAEARAAGSPEPKALPMQILDMATGFLLAFGAQAALLRQQSEGGSWHVRVSLARTGQWLRELDRVQHGFDAAQADFTGLMEITASGYGELTAMRHAAEFSHTPARWLRPSVPPGTHPLAWPVE